MRLIALIFVATVLLTGITVKSACAAQDTELWPEQSFEDENEHELDGGEESRPSDVWEKRPLSLAAQLGLGAPVGLIGVELEYAPVSWLSFGGGVGRTLTGNFNWETEAGLWVTPRVVFDSSALGADIGLSAAPYESFSIMEEHAPWEHHLLAVWFNVGARYQYVSDHGFLFRPFFGVATMINPSEGVCDDGDGNTVECKSISLGYLGLALGYAFPTAAE